MADKKEHKPAKPRTRVKDLPRQEKELSKDEQKKVKGGATRIIPGGIRSTSG